MKIIQKDNYLFNVDVEKTREYYNFHSLCDCGGCRNFYAQIKGLYPELETFLTELGVDITKPDEVFWLDTDENKIQYDPCYTVTGSIKQPSKYEIDFGDINVVVLNPDTPGGYIPNEQTEPYFVLSVFNITLPWILDEPFPSTGATPRYISKVSIIKRIRDLFK